MSAQDKQLNKVDVTDAIRTGQLSKLVSSITSAELEPLLATCYEELLLNNVLLPDETHLAVQRELINLRFFSTQKPKVPLDPDYVPQRVELLLRHIQKLTEEYAIADVDTVFIYTATFIVHNMCILKNHLKSTYNVLPWEEMEFCLAGFVSHYSNSKYLNVFNLCIPNKVNLLDHLREFASILRGLEKYIGDTDIQTLGQRVVLKRENVVVAIISANPSLSSLYQEYNDMRDMHSLEIMEKYLSVALLADCNTKEGSLCIKRTLQVVGEHLKSTLETPKLSAFMSDLLLLSAPRETRIVLQNLRNSLSHANILSENSKLYSKIQKDMKKIATAIQKIADKSKMTKLRDLLLKMVNSDSLADINNFLHIFKNERRSSMMKKIKLLHLNAKSIINEEEHVLQHLDKINEEISAMTAYEQALFTEIKNLCKKSKPLEIKDDFYFYQNQLVSLCCLSNLKNVGIEKKDAIFRSIKFSINRMLKSLPNTQMSERGQYEMEKFEIQKICDLLDKFYQSVDLRLPPSVAGKIFDVIFKIQTSISSDSQNIKWIDEYSRKMNKNFEEKNINEKHVVTNSKDPNCDIIKEKLNELKELVNIKNNDDITNNQDFCGENQVPTEKFAIEITLLEVLSLLDKSKSLSDNHLFLDDNVPLPIGKSIRNHLAHGNASVNLLLSDPFLAVLLNAYKFSEDTPSLFKRKIGKVIVPNMAQVQKKYDWGFNIIVKQKEMCSSLICGNVKSLEQAIVEGADVNSRTTDMRTMLHFAAEGPNLKIIKLLIKKGLQVHVKDMWDQTPLHIAASFGRTDIAKYLITTTGLSVEEVDELGRTPLHLAALNGHNETTETLLSLGASHTVKSIDGKSAVHLAVEYGNLDLVKVLLKRDRTVDENLVNGGFTCLHVAAENGLLEIVEYLIMENADVNAQTAKGGRPLYLASLNGHLDVVKALIANGAYINLLANDGRSALHNAVETNREEIVKVLLEHGAYVDIGDSTYNCSPLHNAVSNGHKGIVELLLKYNADVNFTRFDGYTSLLYAANCGFSEILNLLLQKGSRSNCKDINGSSALHHSAIKGHASVVHSLVNWGLDINAKNNMGVTPLHLAAIHGHLDVVKVLLAAKANIQFFDIDFMTPLHYSAVQGHCQISEFLLQNKADVNASSGPCNFTPLHKAITEASNLESVKLLLTFGADVNLLSLHDCTALHLASFSGSNEIVRVLIKRGAVIDSKNKLGFTPLEMAVQGNHIKTAQVLLDHNANANSIDNSGSTPLCVAAENNNIDIVKMLIKYGAHLNIGRKSPLHFAVRAGHRLIVDFLLKQKDVITSKNLNGSISLLEIAAFTGDWNIVKSLIKKGCEVNYKALMVAIFGGHKEVVDVLLQNGADANYTMEEGTSMLHLAVVKENPDVVQSLLNFGAKLNVRDNKNRTPIEMAIANCNIKNVQVIFQHQKIQVNSQGHEFYLLHIAAEKGNEELVLYLINQGADIHLVNEKGSKPIHIAAREGHCGVLSLFLERGMSVTERGVGGTTVLHYAAMGGQTSVVQFLINKQICAAHINVPNAKGQLPIHYSALGGHTELTKLLLANGAMYNYADFVGRTPLDMADGKDVKLLLESCKNIFKAVKENNTCILRSVIEAGAYYVHVKTYDNSTLLHFAAYKGYKEVCDILLENNANPNIVGKEGSSPLHYAAKYSQLDIVKCLLRNGATYNLQTDSGKTPLDCATQEDVTKLLELVNKCFKLVKNCNTKIIGNLNKIEDVSIVKSILGCCNSNGDSLVVVAIKNNFPQIDELNQILQKNIVASLAMVNALFSNERFEEALPILKTILNERIQIFGENNPSTLEIQEKICVTLYKLSKYSEALHLYELTLQKLETALGPDFASVLNMKNKIALILHRLQRNEEAWRIFQEVIDGQIRVLGEDHSDTLSTKTHAALVLEALGRHDEALAMNNDIYKKHLKTLPRSHPDVLIVLNNIALVLTSMGKYDKALRMFQEVYETRKIALGINHSYTLRAHHNIAKVLVEQGNTKEALKILEEILALQKNTLGVSNIDTVNTERNIAMLHLKQNNVLGYMKAYKSQMEQSNAILGTTHPVNMFSDELYKAIENMTLELGMDNHEVKRLDLLQVAREGDTAAVETLLKQGCNVNYKDGEGRSALHFACSGGHHRTVNLLLDNGADATVCSLKGNTALHIATARGSLEMAQLLISNVRKFKLISYNCFINAKTVLGGSTALHVAAQKGFPELVRCLLRNGAVHNEPDRSHSLTPLQLCTCPRASSLLWLAEEVFACAESGTLHPELLSAPLGDVVHCRNRQLLTPLQIATSCRNMHFAKALVHIIKNTEL